MSSKDKFLAGMDLMPSQSAASREDIERAYAYVESVSDTADDDRAMMWYGWALREAFLSGMQARDEEEHNDE